MTAPRKGRGSRAKALRRKRERGVALLMVMGAIAVLAVMLAEIQDQSGAEAASAIAERDQLQAEYMAKSAIALSRLLVASEPTLRSAIKPLFAFMKKTPPQIPVWEYTDRLLTWFNGEDPNVPASSTFAPSNTGKNLGLLKDGRFEVAIVDEDAKINVNSGAGNEVAHVRAAKEIMGLIAPLQYNSIFEQKDSLGQYSDRIQTCQALIDWTDADEQGSNCDITKLATAANAGVEDAYYQLLAKPYRRKNAPYDSLEELHVVRGVSDDFWATFVDPDPRNPKKRVVTVWGQGAVNVNTANAQTLLGVVCAGAPQAELCVDPIQMQSFITGVTLARGFTMGAPLFGSTTDFVQAMTGKGQIGTVLSGFGVKPVKFQSESEFAKSITVESKMFSMYAVGVKKGYKRETRLAIHAVVDFRNAPGLTQQLLGGTAGATATGTQNPALAGTAASAAGSASGAITSATQPSTGGQVVYYRAE